MKGQAFIGLPNEKAAAKALKEVNGYVLFDKPMVVVSFSKAFLLRMGVKYLASSQYLFFEFMYAQIEISFEAALDIHPHLCFRMIRVLSKNENGFLMGAERPQLSYEVETP